jgi:hypothetical protein
MDIGGILSTALKPYRRHWRTLLAIAAVVVVPFTLLQYLFGHWVRGQGEATSNQMMSTSSWAAGTASLVTALAGLLMFLVLTGAITRAVAAEVAGEDPSLEQSYRFGFHRLGSVLLVSVLVGLAVVVGGHGWHAFGTLLVAGLLTGIVNAVITAPFDGMSWFVQAIAAAVVTVVALPYGVLVGVLLYLYLRARTERLSLETLRADLQASAT